MKLFKIAGLAGVVATALLACNKDKVETAQAEVVDDFSNLAKVQVQNAALGIQRNFLFMDAGRLSGTVMQYTQTTSANFTYLGNGLTYGIAPGTHSFTLRDTLTTSPQPALSFTGNFQANKSYTIFFYDTLSSVKQLTVENNIEIPTDTSARVRFANFVFVKNGLPSNVDVYSKLLDANVFSNIPVKDVTPFIPYRTGTRFTSGVTDSLIVRAAGTMNALDTATVTFNQKRSYTLLYRGRSSTNGAGNNFLPRTLSNTVTF